ncbi:MAG: hypothetical protein ACRDMW_09830 [Gaiellaceae bacterium]
MPSTTLLLGGVAWASVLSLESQSWGHSWGHHSGKSVPLILIGTTRRDGFSLESPQSR